MFREFSTSIQTATTTVATTGVCRRSFTSATRAGARRSNDQAKRLRVAIRKPVGVHQSTESTKQNATNTCKKLGNARNLTSAGRQGAKHRGEFWELKPRQRRHR